MITDVKFVPGSQGAYAISNNGSISAFHQTSNPYAAPVAWNDASLANVFNRIAPELNGLNVYVQGESNNSGGGCADAWIIGTGIETSRTSDTITADAVFGGGQWRITIVASPYTGFHPPNSLCRTLILSRSPPLGIGWWDCGSDDESIGEYLGQCIWAMDYIDTVPFSCTFTISDDSGSCGDCGSSTGSGLAITRYSTNSGNTFAPIKVVGFQPSLGSGMDTQKIGNVAIAGAGSQTYKTSNGGDWVPYGGTIPPSSQPTAIYIPRWQFGGTIVGNTSSTPQYLLGSGTISTSGQTLWKVTSAGSIFTDISPRFDGTLAGEIVSPDALNMPWNSGSTIAAIARFNEGVKFCITVNTGATWRFESLGDDAREVVTRRGDTQVQQAILANGSMGGYIPNYRGTLVTDYDRFTPTGNVFGVDVLG